MAVITLLLQKYLITIYTTNNRIQEKKNWHAKMDQQQQAEQQKKQLEAQKAAEEQRQVLLARILSTEAKERCFVTIFFWKLANPTIR